MNHPQIAYYLFLALAIMTIFYAINWIKNKEGRHLVLAFAFTIGAGLTGVLTNAVSILSTYEYQKETIRGGATAIADSTASKDNSATGLTKGYALSYSMNIAEPFVMMVPRMYGGSTGYDNIEQEKSKAIESLQQVGQQNIETIAQQTGLYLPNLLNTYWGGMTKASEVGTSGPPYLGAIICFLAIIAMFILDGKHKWWILTTVLFTIMMSWGSYFDALNGFLYKNLPMYNKFRAPSMILVISQLLLPLLAVICVNKIAESKDKKALLPSFKKGILATAGVFALLFAIYLISDFLSGSDKELMRQVNMSNNPQLMQIFDNFFDGLKQDRKSLMLGDIWRSLGFTVVAALLLFLAIRKSLNEMMLGTGLVLFAMIDLITIDVKYMNYENFRDKTENETSFFKTKSDEEILKDSTQFRVFNVAGNAFSENITSYYYNSIGGYHPAKIGIYQELIENQLRKSPMNMPVLNMLNTKYLIQKDANGQTQALQKNEGALGSCWLVKHIIYVKGANEEMKALDSFNPRDTAIVQESFRSSIPFNPVADSTATISLVKNDNDVVTYQFNAAADQFAVFSEVYYKNGWKAYIDNKETPVVKVNYVLRGLAVPAGKHAIRFEFKPEGFYTGKKLTSVFSIILLVVLAAGLFMEWKGRKQTALANRA
jgi:hypothetical protein